MHIRVENLHGRKQGPACARVAASSATPITQITLARSGDGLNLSPAAELQKGEKPWTDRCSCGAAWVAGFHIITCFTTNTKTRVKSF